MALLQNRRRFIHSLGGAGLATTLMGCQQSQSPVRTLDLSASETAFKSQIKLTGSLATETIYVSFGGVLWGILGNKTPAPLCGFQGLARSDWINNADGSFMQTAFDIGYFSELKTREPLDTLINPLTGERVRPFHFKYGGTDKHHTLEDYIAKEQAKISWTQQGQQVWMTERLTGEFPSPLSPQEWPRESAGEVFRAGSETTYAASLSQMIDPDCRRADYTMFWSSVISWEPWLLMDGTPGYVMWRGVGSKLATADHVPAPMKAYIAKTQPNYFEVSRPWDGRASTYADFKLNRQPEFVKE